MFRRPILLNRPLKSKKSAVYRPGLSLAGADDAVEAPAAGLKRTARLAEKLKENSY